MNVETLIYVYLAICVSMILFNCACIVEFKRRDKRIAKKSKNFEIKVEEQIGLIKQGNRLEETHKKYLNNKLKRIGNLMAFDETLERLYQEEPEPVKQYLTDIYSVFIYLMMEYQHKDNVKAAYSVSYTHL